MSQPTNHPQVQLGCGTLILIAIIVAVFSQGGQRDELRAIGTRLERIEKILTTDKTSNGGTGESTNNGKNAQSASPGTGGPGDSKGTASDNDKDPALPATPDGGNR